jgi:hypothetical protein
MKIIFSRKGFDSRNGGVASPIFPDGRIRSLPIPDRTDKVQYTNIKFGLSDVEHGSQELGSLVEELSFGPRKMKSSIKRTDFCHLDPDLIRTDIARKAGWLPIFGQGNAAASHLLNYGVREGDLFLFFGWFHRVHEVNGRFRFDPERQDVHLIFGWLQIGEAWCRFNAESIVPKWAKYHPHLVGSADEYHNRSEPVDAVFIAKRWLELPGLRMRRPGGGVFEKYHPDLCLTKPGETRGHWQLPLWMYPSPGRKPLTYNGDRRKWSKDRTHCYLHTADIGQEFILDCAGYPDAMVNRWLIRLFAHAV